MKGTSAEKLILKTFEVASVIVSSSRVHFLLRLLFILKPKEMSKIRMLAVVWIDQR